MKFIKKLFKKDYSHFFIYKWGIFAGAIQVLFITLFTFSLFTAYSIIGAFSSNNIFLLIFYYCYFAIFLIISLMLIFGVPIYFMTKKKMFAEGLLILFITMTTIFLFLSVLLLLNFNL